jgi:protein O-GlcNAc transferase
MNTCCDNFDKWSLDDLFDIRTTDLQLTLPQGLLPEGLLEINTLATRGCLDDARARLAVLSLNDLYDGLDTDSVVRGIFCLVTAMTLALMHDYPDADTWFQRALRHLNHPAIFNEYACFCQTQGQWSRALSYRQQALDLAPENPIVRANLASDLVQTGRMDEGIDLLQRAVRDGRATSVSESMLLCYLHYDPHCDRQTLFDHHCHWGQAHAAQHCGSFEHAHDPDPRRRLRIGFVSPDFFRHSVAFFFESLLDGVNRDDLELIAYGNVLHPDEVTERLQAKCDQYRSIRGMEDRRAAELIHADRIDILVDLTGHWRENRLKVFAHRPAPIQVAYLGYPNTTGLSQMDYRLTDALVDPPASEAFYTEQLVRLPGGFLCYRGPDAAPEVGPLPADQSGTVTFGSFNNQCKINSECIDLWARILQTKKNTKLVLKFKGASDPQVTAHYHGLFRQRGVNPVRVDLVGWKGFEDHLGSYHNIDIALDTYPYNGTTTTCEALWMGVPVVSLCGEKHISRVGLSLLSQLDLEVFVAESTQAYVAKAVDFADQTANLRRIRQSLRPLMRSSPLCAYKDFAQDVEQAFRDMWCQWCKAHEKRTLKITVKSQLTRTGVS